MEPVMFTTTLLNRSTRNNPQSWKVLGFIPDLDALKSSASKAKIRSKISGKGQQARNYHSCLSVILRDFQRLQGLETPVLGHVRCGDLVQHLHCKLLLGVVLNALHIGQLDLVFCYFLKQLKQLKQLRVPIRLLMVLQGITMPCFSTCSPRCQRALSS